jgi:hypothetical protein
MEINSSVSTEHTKGTELWDVVTRVLDSAKIAIVAVTPSKQRTHYSINELLSYLELDQQRNVWSHCRTLPRKGFEEPLESRNLIKNAL